MYFPHPASERRQGIFVENGGNHRPEIRGGRGKIRRKWGKLDKLHKNGQPFLIKHFFVLRKKRKM
jgi:hypothetical protein